MGENCVEKKKTRGGHVPFYEGPKNKEKVKSGTFKNIQAA